MRIDKAEQEKYLISKGDLVICEGGYPGTSAIWEEEYSIFFQKALHRVRFFLPYLNYYFHYYLYSSSLSGYLDRYYTGSGIQHFTGASLDRFIFPLPPLAEQHRIVAKVNELMVLCDELEAAEKELDALEEHFAEYLPKSILQEAVQGKLVPQDPKDEPASELLKRIQKEKSRLVKDGKIKKEKPLPPITETEIPYDLPDGWVWCRLGEIITLVSGRDLEINQYNDEKRGIPYITGASTIENNKILINRWTDTPVVISQINDLLLSCKGTIGKIVFNDIGNCHIARQVMAVRMFTPHIVKEYVKLFLNSYVIQLSIQAKSIIPGIIRENVLNAMFPLPPLTEQHRIVAKVDELMALCDELKLARELPEILTFYIADETSFDVLEDEEPLLKVARGESAQPSEKLKKARDDIFKDDYEK
jgi:type I restriction enzyme S subunit